MLLDRGGGKGEFGEKQCTEVPRRKTGSSRFVENAHIFVIFFIQCMFRALLTCLGEFNHVASPVNCINCTVINPTVGKKGPNFRDLFGSLFIFQCFC